MRKLAAAVLAVPVLALLYMPLLARRSVAARVGLLASVGILVTVAALGLSRPVPTTAAPPANPITALAESAFQSIGAAAELDAAVDITFSEKMDPGSVAAALMIRPATAVRQTWNADRTVLSVRPTKHWSAGSYHTLTVQPGALDASGRPMSGTVRAIFITRPATSGRIVAARTTGAHNSVVTAFRISFDHPVATAAVREAFRVSPAVEGRLVADESSADAPASVWASVFTFSPSAALAPGTTYDLSLGPLADAAGAPVRASEPLSITTPAAPRVIRVRPAKDATTVDRTANISVRFSEPMQHASTRAAFAVTSAGKAVGGSFRFAESSTVLVFDPSSTLPPGATVIVGLAPTAMSTQGVALGRRTETRFTTAAPKGPTVARPPAAAVPRPAPAAAPRPRTTSGGAVGGGSWGAVETYYLRLMNCTRTGGVVTSSGSCSSPGGRNVAPLRLDAGISTKVSRPYAKKLAVNNQCTHFSGGTPGDRLRRAGYTSYIWAENLGCRSGSAMSAVLGSHLFFQSEWSYNGGHYVNLMNSKYDRAGIGVWVAGGRVRLVVDFYHPR